MTSSIAPNCANSSPRLAGHLVVDCLIAQGITHAFGVPGESYLAVLDGFVESEKNCPNKINFITCRHEGGAAFMAEAAGKLGWSKGGQPGVCFVTRGPGATNASIGLHTAFQDSTPMVLFVGDVGSDFRGREAFQEMDYGSFFASISKSVERIDDAERIPEVIARAFSTALNGRPGPVVIVLPEDLLIAQVKAQPLPKISPVQADISQKSLQTIRDMLLKSEQPFVIVGGGGWTPENCQALETFATNWQLPVGNAFRFQDTFDNFHPNYAGDVGIGINPKLAERIKNADLIIALGVRLGEMTTSGYSLLSVPTPKQKLIHIHSSAEELGRVYQADLKICATMNAAALSLQTLAAPDSIAWSEYSASANAEYKAWIAPQALPNLPFDDAGGEASGAAGNINMPRLIKLLQKHLPKDAVVTNGAGNYASWMHRYFQHAGLCKGHKIQIAPTSGSMGVGVPAAVAANLMTGRVAFTIAGDGDFLMTGQELSTATHHGAGTIVLVLNNGTYGTIRMHQERDYPSRVSGSDIKSAHFATLAEGYGYHGARITHSDQFESELVAALKRLQKRQGTVIELIISPEIITTRSSLSSIRNQSLSKA